MERGGRRPRRRRGGGNGSGGDVVPYERARRQDSPERAKGEGEKKRKRGNTPPSSGRIEKEKDDTHLVDARERGSSRGMGQKEKGNA